jgi:hypothetical protein
MVFNATFNNISVISWQSVVLVEETGVPEKTTDKLHYIMLYTSPWAGFEFTTSVVIGTDYNHDGPNKLVQYNKNLLFHKVDYIYYVKIGTVTVSNGSQENPPPPFLHVEWKFINTF